jgi:hypothetical protein
VSAPRPSVSQSHPLGSETVRQPPDGRPSLAALAARRLALSRAVRKEAMRGLAVSRPSQRHETGETAPDAGSRKAAGNDCLTVSPPRDETVRQPAGAAGAAEPSEEVAARAAALLRFAEEAHAALADREPDLIDEAERAAIQAEPLLPPEGTPARAALDQRQAETVAGLLEAARVRPSCFEGEARRPPPQGAYCSACRSRRWWWPRQPKTDGTGPSAHWRCATCRPPTRLREDQIVEVVT